MADEKTDELSTKDLLKVLIEEVGQVNLRLNEMNARLIKVEAFVDDRSRDTRPRLDLIHKEIADLKHNDIARLHQEIADSKASLQQEIANSEERLRQEIANSEERLRQEIANSEERLQQQITPLQQRVADVYTEVRGFGRQLKLLREEMWGERKERAELEERIEILERAAA